MSVYRWQGVSPKGETLKGEMEASSREAVIIRLRSQRIQPQPSRIKEKGKGLDFDIAVPSFGSPVKARDIVVFTRQFATMIDAGLPIVQCLSILAAQTDSKPFRRAITTVKDDVESGTTLAEAIRKHSKIFSDLYTHMVQAGEVGGILDTILAGLAIRYAYKTEQGHVAIDRFLLRVPIFGPLIRKSAVARFTRTLGTLVSSGVPILDALTITARTAGNKVVEHAIMNARQSISNGQTIADPLIESKVFPPMVCQMISVGETTGALDTMLQKIADFYEDEVDNMVNNLMSLLEPAVILFLGVVIGGLVISMYLPIFKLGAVMDG